MNEGVSTSKGNIGVLADVLHLIVSSFGLSR